MTVCSSDIPEDAIDEAEIRVRPHWLPCGTKFWYRQHAKRGSFFLVDAASKTKKVAFDHKALADALSTSTGGSIDSDRLPLERIEIKDNSVQFQYDGKKWHFNGQLECRGDAESGPTPVTKSGQDATVHTGGKSEITFTNASAEPLNYEWLNFDGRPERYGKIDPGQSKSQSTYEGHIWRLVRPDGKVVCKVEATADRCTARSDPEEAKKVKDKPDAKADTKPEVSFNGHNATIKNSDGTISTILGILPEGHSWSEEYSVSADGKYCVLWEQTPEQDHPLNLVASVPQDQLEPKLHTSQYLKPGDRVETFRPRLFDVKAEIEVILDDKLFSNPYQTLELDWSQDAPELYCLYNERGHQVMRVISIGPDGVRVIIEEKSDTFIDYSSKTYPNYLKNTDELLWASERDGWNRLYLIDMADGSAKPITPSNQVLYAVNDVDEEARQLWYTVRGSVPEQDPYYNQLVRVNFDGTGLTTLTAGDGSHSWSWSPDKTFLVDTWSRVDSALTTVLRDGKTGEELLKLEQGSLDSLVLAGWTVPERFEAPSRDGKHQIYGLIVKPSQFDPEKSYPIVEYVYAGPQDQHVQKSFSVLKTYHTIANLGFIIVTIDGMGTNWRCKAFHDVCYKNLKDAGFPDRIAWIKAAAADRPWMDTSRVGIYGGSAGGQNAMGALLFHNEFYKVAVSDCGCHDNRMDKIWWNEQWMGWPVDDSYAQSSNVVHAHKLEGKLMLMVGALDDNVDPSSTFQVVHALNEADKDYELVLFPRGKHGVGLNSKYGRRRLEEFLCKHLLK